MQARRRSVRSCGAGSGPPGRSAIFLDGDALREVIAEDLGHSVANRRASAMRNARLCRMLASQGTDVVCPTISLFHEIQVWNRSNIPGYCEIYLRVPMEELRRRDPKGIYAAADRGDLRDMVGLDVPAELPETPNLVLDNFGLLDSSAAVDRIWKECVRRDSSRFAPPAGKPAFATKAETLERLAPALRSAEILPQIRFSVADWHEDRNGVLDRLGERAGAPGRSSCGAAHKMRMARSSSQAGCYDSMLGVCGDEDIAQAIDQVIASFGPARGGDDQIFVQPMLEHVAMAGVAFSRPPSGNGPYYIVNYDDRSGRTDRVTGGTGDNLQTFLCLKSRADACPPELAPVLALVSRARIDCSPAMRSTSNSPSMRTVRSTYFRCEPLR